MLVERFTTAKELKAAGRSWNGEGGGDGGGLTSPGPHPRRRIGFFFFFCEKEEEGEVSLRARADVQRMQIPPPDLGQFSPRGRRTHAARLIDTPEHFPRPRAC